MIGKAELPKGNVQVRVVLSDVNASGCCPGRPALEDRCRDYKPNQLDRSLQRDCVQQGSKNLGKGKR